ncbi:MAG TPA: hypothetical protein VLG15_02075 [Thermoanaerobaculia bacterium]|nr:hypothetical protein [Thermoanaerobaculia bacterium]
MKKPDSRLAATALVLFSAGWIALTASSTATMPLQKKAKELGFSADNCLYCHNEKLPKKGAVTQNGRGEWLIAEKEKRHAKEVDVTWLKYYPEEKKK